MKRLAMVLALTLVLGAGSVWAQDVPSVEGFVGGSVANIEDNGFKLTPFGWVASVTGNMNKAFGIVGEAGGSYRKGMKFHSFLGGGQFTHRLEKISVFGQAKAGILNSRGTNGSGSTDNNFQVAFGGGIDWNASERIAIRVFQFDWLPLLVDNGTGGHSWIKKITRGSIGIVFKGSPK